MSEPPDNPPAVSFVDACDLLNREITRALVLQPLVIAEARHSTRAATEIHEGVLKRALRVAHPEVETPDAPPEK